MDNEQNSEKVDNPSVGLGDLLYWRDVKDELPGRGYNFLAYYKNQPPLIMIAWRDIHGNYILQGGGDTTGHGGHPKFSHWMPLPKKPV